MSVQFGKCNFDGKPVDPNDLDAVRPVLAPYGPDGEGYICKDNLGILYRAFHTTRESHRETQPYCSRYGSVITWDGRLDNREDLIEKLGGDLSSDSTDLEIVAAGYERWGVKAFRKLIGDWAMSIWNSLDQSLILGKDFIGARHLYYLVDNDQATWSTVLDPLVLFAGRTFSLSEEYIAGWLSFFPATHLTPFMGIHAVPASCYVALRAGSHVVREYWNCDSANQIRYKNDSEYEEHFRTVFAEAVRRRLRSHKPVIAELSGGMDSSSIVCTADTLIARGLAETPRLDTVSYIADSEPNWDERPYLTEIEDKRGRRGFHIDADAQGSFSFQFQNHGFAATPGSVGRQSVAAKQFALCLVSQGNRAVLSGIGGDEVLGGVPTPIPELQDLLARGQLRTLAHYLKLWALHSRRPWFHLLLEALHGFLPPTLVASLTYKRPAVWIDTKFSARQRAAFEGYEDRVKLFGPLPSFQHNVMTLSLLRRQLACSSFSKEFPCEKRYPFLDRGLVEFIASLPREQLVRPGHRRSLMRRALAGIVPERILNRRRKAYVALAPMAAISAAWIGFLEFTKQMVSTEHGLIDNKLFLEALRQATQSHEIPIVAVMRTFAMEVWLRALRDHELLTSSTSRRAMGPCSPTHFQSPSISLELDDLAS